MIIYMKKATSAVLTSILSSKLMLASRVVYFDRTRHT